jgi:hypothetical protein
VFQPFLGLFQVQGKPFISDGHILQSKLPIVLLLCGEFFTHGNVLLKFIEFELKLNRLLPLCVTLTEQFQS